MDINYLLWWQDFRETTHGTLTPFMDGISEFSVSYLILLPAFLYWCWDKRRGLMTLASFCLCVAVTAVIKLTACVYRPWIRDPRIIPATKSLPTSYSFPSGHTAMGTPLYLGSALIFWQKNWTKILAVLCVVLAVLNPLSRNYLGVHTPQDVCMSFVLSIACLYVVWKVGTYFQKYPEKENVCLGIVFVVCMLTLIYLLYKPYPMDYVNGKLLVNPHKMLKSAFEGMGILMGFCVARYIEKTWIRFKETGLSIKGVIYSVAGLVLLYLFFTYAGKPFKHLLGSQWGRFAWAFTLVLYIVALYPLVLKYFFQNRHVTQVNKTSNPSK